MKLTLILSMRHKDHAIEVAQKLEELGHEVKVPMDSIKELKEKEVLDEPTMIRIHQWLVYSWIDRAIPWADAVLIINKGHPEQESYIGANTWAEFGAAVSHRKRIYSLYEYGNQEELMALKIPVVGGIEALREHFLRG